MQSRKYFPIILSLFISAGCTSLKDVSTSERQNAIFPVINPLPVQIGVTGDKSDDFKLVDGRSGPIRLALRMGKADIADDLKILIWKIIQNQFPKEDMVITDLPEELTDKFDPFDTAIRTYGRENHLDGILDVVWRLEGEESAKTLTVVLKNLDPYDASEFASTKAVFRMEKRAVDSAHQAEMYRGRQGVVFLSDSAPELAIPVQSPGENPDEFRRFFRSCVSGSLSIASTAAETKIFRMVDGRAVLLGNAPIKNLIIEEGLYDLSIQRRGYAPISKQFRMRAGRKSDFFINWPDDTSVTSLTVLSAPAGLRVSTDGVVQGSTPIFFVSSPGQRVNVELSRAAKDGKYEIVGESTVSFDAAGARSELFLTDYQETFNQTVQGDYWQLTSEDAAVSFGGAAGLSFRTTSKSPDSWQGIISLPVVFSSFDMEVELAEGSDSYLAVGLLTDNDSVLCEMNGERYSTFLFKGRESSLNRTFRSQRPAQNGIRKLRLRFDKSSGTLKVSLDGDTMFEGPLQNPGRGRIALLTHPGSADGRVLARHLTFRSEAR